jgi:hypothetical protein
MHLHDAVLPLSKFGMNMSCRQLCRWPQYTKQPFAAQPGGGAEAEQHAEPGHWPGASPIRHQRAAMRRITAGGAGTGLMLDKALSDRLGETAR